MKAAIDHLVYTAPNLEMGMDNIEELLGVRPVMGGQHPQWGTHNAILSLGNAYLEVIAPCPGLETPARGRWLQQFYQQAPRLATWAVQTTNITQLYQQLIDEKMLVGKIEKGQRKRADGSLMQWQLTNPYLMPQDGILPFYIDWGQTTHPSSLAPFGGELIALEITTPDDQELHKLLGFLGIDIKVLGNRERSISVRINTKKGLVVLK